MSAHTCHVSSCVAKVPPRMLMCRPHWRQVPQALKDDVLNTYQQGQERGDVRPSVVWLKAARAAITAVEDRERAQPGLLG